MGDVCDTQDGSSAFPFIISVHDNLADAFDERDTSESSSDEIDSYPPFTPNESGPEYFYVFQVTDWVLLDAWIETPEPSGVDIDLHLLSSIQPLVTLERDNSGIMMFVEPGIYYLVLDTYVSSGGEKPGSYRLHVEIEPFYAGSPDAIIPLGETLDAPLSLPFGGTDWRDTSMASSDEIDTYPPYTANESGPEYIYGFTVDEAVRMTAEILAPEPDGVDIDVHLLSSLNPLEVIGRGNTTVIAQLDPGTYYLVLDTFVSGGIELTGPYTLSVAVRSAQIDPSDYFNGYVLDAVDTLYENYRLLGYDSAVLTHDIEYGPHGTISRSDGAKTMCVAAVMEVILTAIELYAAETGDGSVWDYLPKRSFERLGENDLKAHIWVNYDLDSGGTADALRHFGMGENIPFEELTPGSFINLNRTTGTGHAVVFLAFIDIEGNEYDTHNDDVIGFLYFSSQGSRPVGDGGLDYRYAIFDEFGSPEMPYNRDTRIIYSTNQRYLNTGMMFHPSHWVPTIFVERANRSDQKRADVDVSFFDEVYFDGVTVDD